MGLAGAPNGLIRFDTIPQPWLRHQVKRFLRWRISHPDRVIYPDVGISKIQLARYYERIADWIVPHVEGRPLTLVHCPAGIAAPCNFLKHAKAWGPSALRRVRIQEKTKLGEYLVADSIEAVVSLAQMGIVEIHTWNSTADDIERPNRGARSPANDRTVLLTWFDDGTGVWTLE